MKKMFTKISYCLTVALGISMFSSAAIAKTELTMYYPIAVGGKLTQAVDSIVADFMAENPDIEVNAIYSCLLYTSPSPRDRQKSRMPSSA